MELLDAIIELANAKANDTNVLETGTQRKHFQEAEDRLSRAIERVALALEDELAMAPLQTAAYIKDNLKG